MDAFQDILHCEVHCVPKKKKLKAPWVWNSTQTLNGRLLHGEMNHSDWPSPGKIVFSSYDNADNSRSEQSFCRGLSCLFSGFLVVLNICDRIYKYPRKCCFYFLIFWVWEVFCVLLLLLLFYYYYYYFYITMLSILFSTYTGKILNRIRLMTQSRPLVTVDTSP